MRGAFAPDRKGVLASTSLVPLEQELPFAGISSNGRIWEESEFFALPIQNKYKVDLASGSVAYSARCPSF
jgi:hypothetical protein